MKIKRYSRIVLIFGLFILTLGLMTPFLYWNYSISHNGATGMIGGADAPTYMFMLSSLFDGILIVWVLLGMSLIISSGFCLLFSRAVQRHCNIYCSAISLGLSCVGALGLACVFIWYITVSFGGMSRFPIQYPVSIWLGSLCLFAFLVLIVLYFKTRMKNWSIKGFIIDILTSIVYLPMFFYAFSYLYGILT